MKGIILAGGLGSRLMPLTLVTNKHLLPVYDKPMIYYPIECLLNAGIDEILIVTGGESPGDFLKLLHDGKHLGIRDLAYAYQDGESGIADALTLGESFADGEKVCVILGDNIIEKNIVSAARDFENQPTGARLLLTEVDEPQQYGIAQFDGGPDGQRLIDIIEKPNTPPSRMAVTGIYFYDADVFDICRSLRPSERGELEITDVNRHYLKRGDLEWSILDGWWADAGTHDGMYRATRLVAEGGANHPDEQPETGACADRTRRKGSA